MQIVIDMPTMLYHTLKLDGVWGYPRLTEIIRNGKPLSKGHGRLGDLDELERRISNFVEHDANITDDYTIARQRFIVDGIRDTPTIIEADKEGSDADSN